MESHLRGCFRLFAKILGGGGNLGINHELYFCIGGSKGEQLPGTPPGPFFKNFHAVFGKKNRLAHPLWELAPPSGKSRIRQCFECSWHGIRLEFLHSQAVGMLKHLLISTCGLARTCSQTSPPCPLPKPPRLFPSLSVRNPGSTVGLSNLLTIFGQLPCYFKLAEIGQHLAM